MTHHLVARAIDAIRNEFSRAHPSLPSKVELTKQVEALQALVAKLPEDLTFPVATSTKRLAAGTVIAEDGQLLSGFTVNDALTETGAAAPVDAEATE